MKLFISGAGSFNPKEQPPPRVLKVKVFLDASKDGELFTSEQVAVGAEVRREVLQVDAGRLLLSYSHKVGGKRYWGKPVTIQQLVKETK